MITRKRDLYPGDDPLFDLHYRFSHHWVPDQAARHRTDFLEILLGPRGSRILRAGWGEVAGRMGFLELPPLPRGVLEPCVLQGGGVWYALPEPEFVTGVRVQALVPGSGGLEVYQSEHSLGNRTLLCGWELRSEGHRHLQVAELPDATPQAFLEALVRRGGRRAGRG